MGRAVAFVAVIQKGSFCNEVTTMKLLQKLAYLPLSITQAAAYLNNKILPILEYLELLDGKEEDIVGLMRAE